MKYCQKCGTENNDIAAFCSKCGAPFQPPVAPQQPIQPIQEVIEKPKKKKKGCLIAVIVILVIIVGLFALMIGGGDDTIITLDENGDVYQNGQIVAQQDFKNSCTSISYDELARNPENYKGQNFVFTGEVIQCELSYETTYFARVNVTVDEYGYYEDTIYVTFEIPEGADKILEEDIIKLYGVCRGTESYTSIFGEQITIPSIQAAYVELVK